MTGTEHYLAAEKCLASVDDDSETSIALLAEAQVHATLALAAATALSRHNFETGFPQADRMAWYNAASGQPADNARRKAAEQAEAAELAQEAAALVCQSCRRPVERTCDDDFQHAVTGDGVACTAWPVVPVRAGAGNESVPR